MFYNRGEVISDQFDHLKVIGFRVSVNNICVEMPMYRKIQLATQSHQCNVFEAFGLVLTTGRGSSTPSRNCLDIRPEHKCLFSGIFHLSASDASAYQQTLAEWKRSNM